MGMLGVNPIGVQNVGGVAGQNQHSVYPAKLVFPPNVGAFAFSSMIGVNLAGQGHAGLVKTLTFIWLVDIVIIPANGFEGFFHLFKILLVFSRGSGELDATRYYCV